MAKIKINIGTPTAPNWIQIDADTVDGKHFSDIQADAQTKASQALSDAKTFVWDFGLEKSKTISQDLDTVKKSGFYKILSTSSNAPTTITSGAPAYLIVNGDGGNYASQLYISPVFGKVYYRGMYDSSTSYGIIWSSWKEVGGVANASQLSISDSDGYFQSTNVEGALQEIGQVLGNANSTLIDSFNTILGY
jgi:hypothetical protein